MEKVTAELYQLDPDRYTVVPGDEEGAPTCSYGHTLEWVGYDNIEKKYIRFTKSVFKKLVEQEERNIQQK